MSKPGQTSRPRRLPTPGELASRDRRIARAVRDGLTVKEAMRRFSLDSKTIRTICAAHGVEPGKRGVRL